MNKEENNPVTEELITTPSESQGFNPNFVALLEHIGRMIAKDLIQAAKEKSKSKE